MIGLWKFFDEQGKGRGLLAIYLLYSLRDKRKSGYEILKEIDEKCKGTWTPSKGTLYPLLKKLEQEGVITIDKIGTRSKQIFVLTDKGEKALSELDHHRKELRERFLQFRNLFIDIMEGERKDMISMLIDINEIAFESTAKKEDIKKILSSCMYELKALNQGTQ